jgi:glyoxylase I family protein
MRIHHIALRTSDLDRLERFYVGLLGLPVVARHGTRSIWLELEGTLLMLERAEDGERRIARSTNELLAFSVEPSELPSYVDKLSSAGVVVEASTEFTRYFRDPDGRRIALSHYPRASRA